MNEYDVKRGKYDNVKADNLKTAMKESFGNVSERDGKLFASFGALKELTAWPGESKKSLCVETKMDPTVDDETAQKTIKAYNTFLENVTGLNAKERGKRAQKKVKQGGA
ncbi:MAG: DUF5611 family protein [Candidatus Thermoplasmatota archaeon]|nr:DUF5611 family protein [Candidatus Thermoplasmatota archaeon]